MTDPEIETVLRRLDYINDAVMQHAADDRAQHAAVASKIDEKYASLSAKVDQMAEVLTVWNGVKGFRSVVVAFGSFMVALVAIGAAIKMVVMWLKS